MIIKPAATRNHLPGHRCKLRNRLVRFATQHDIGAGLVERCARCHGTMRTDHDDFRSTPQCSNPIRRHAQLGLRAAPEQVRGSGWDYEEVFAKAIQALTHSLRSEVFHEGVDKQDVMALLAQHLAS